MPGLTRTCCQCHKQLPTEQMKKHASIRSQTSSWYCPTCLAEKKEREAFTEKVCAIFGTKMPGQRIWKDRKELIEQYGYTDQTLIDCLDYLYTVKKMKKLSVSLILIKNDPSIVNEMFNYKKQEEEKAQQIIEAIKTPVKEYIVPIQENTEKKVEKWNLEDWLDD